MAISATSLHLDRRTGARAIRGVANRRAEGRGDMEGVTAAAGEVGSAVAAEAGPEAE